MSKYIPNDIVCDHCLSIVVGLYWDYTFEGKTYYYCTPTCAAYGMHRHNVDEFDRVQERRHAEQSRREEFD